MKDILYDYKMTATTWVYLSSLITIAVYFKFRRFWSVRNLDLVGLILFAPGLLMIQYGQESKTVSPQAAAAAEAQTGSTDLDGGSAGSPSAALPDKTSAKASPIIANRQIEQFGYRWLFVVSGFFLFRMLVDPAMVRRPLLEPNLSASGLTFSCAAMLVFLMSNVITDRSLNAEPAAVSAHDQAADGGEAARNQLILKQRGPGYPLFLIFSSESNDYVKRITAIAAHLAIVFGLVLIGYRHFDNTHTGIAAATLYLLLPYTAEYTPELYHVVPGALLVWAIQCYRRPVFAGIFMGLAAGLTWYPLFLLPLWCSFYWRRGLLRFSISVAVVLALVIASLALTPASVGTFWNQLLQTIGAWPVRAKYILGFWEGPLSPFRIPVIVAFCAMCVSMVFWPAQKNLGSLLACSAAIMLGTQFWMAREGGTHMAWYLPLLTLAILRPNLEDRVALSAISEGWVKWRK